MLILITGCSGAGKNTIIQELQKKNPKIRFLKSCTTRQRRPQETDESYFFLSKNEFDELLKQDKIFEYEEIHQNFYGIKKESLDKAVEDEKDNIHYIKDVGVLGQISVVRALKNKIPVVSIFLEVPRAELIKRLKGRGEKDIDLRLARMEFEMGYINNFDEIVKNVNIEKTLARIEKIIAKYQKKYYNKNIIKEK